MNNIFINYLFKRTFIFIVGIYILFLFLNIIFTIVNSLDDLNKGIELSNILVNVIISAPFESMQLVEGACLLGFMLSMSISNSEGNLNVLRTSGFSPLRITFINIFAAMAFFVTIFLLNETFFKELAKDYKTENFDEFTVKQEKKIYWVRSKNKFFGYYINKEENSVDGVIYIDKEPQQNKNIYVDYKQTSVNKKDIEKIFKDYEDKFTFPKINEISINELEYYTISDLHKLLKKLKESEAEFDNFMKSHIEKNLFKTAFSFFDILAILLFFGAFTFKSLRESSIGSKIVISVVSAFFYNIIQDLSISIFISYKLSVLVGVLLPATLMTFTSYFLYRRI